MRGLSGVAEVGVESSAAAPVGVEVMVGCVCLGVGVGVDAARVRRVALGE